MEMHNEVRQKTVWARSIPVDFGRLCGLLLELIIDQKNTYSLCQVLDRDSNGFDDYW